MERRTKSDMRTKSYASAAEIDAGSVGESYASAAEIDAGGVREGGGRASRSWTAERTRRLATGV